MKKTVLAATVSAVLLGLATPGYAQDASCPPTDNSVNLAQQYSISAGEGLCQKGGYINMGDNALYASTISLAPNILTKLSSIDTFSASVTDLTRRINESSTAVTALEDGAVMYDDKTAKIDILPALKDGDSY